MDRRLVLLAICATALLAAVSAHVAIDVVGDYLVPDDTYDHVAHGSRLLFTLVAAGIAAGAAALLFTRLCNAATSIRLRARMLRVSRLHIAGAGAAIIGCALFLVPAMEALDMLRAGADFDAPAALFGGSLLLGISTTFVCAVAWSALVLGLSAWLARYRERVAQLLYELLYIERAPLVAQHERRAAAALLAAAPARRARHHDKRGPPARLRVHPCTNAS